MIKEWGIGIAALLLLPGCDPSREELRQKAGSLAAEHGMQAKAVPGGEFTLQVYERIKDPAAPVRVYIEGDGLAWLTRTRVSPDPTPPDPMALQLAVRDTSPNVAYIGRPCQYIMSNNCNSKYWTTAQFNERVIASVNRVMDRWRGHKLSLVGYSGGGGVALLVAARRDDVTEIRTVAGNLDSAAFTKMHGVSSLSDSLNPASVAARTATIPQRHFVGDGDEVVRPSLVQHYQDQLPGGHCSAYTLVHDVTHHKGWPEQWAELLAQPLKCITPADPKL